jgi:NAD(P)-dependent dehydrogenase (short-subunit alcohol dehydrogenase family)
MNYEVAIVTGGASGIGKEICLWLAGEGTKVIIADLNYEKAKEVEDIIIKAGGEGRARKTDVSQSAEVEAMIKETFEQYKRIDLLVNNAGIGVNGEFQDMDLASWDRIFNVNFRGMLYGTYYVYPIMMKQGFGQIVNVSSLAGLLPGGLMTSYTASKHAVVGFTLALRSEAKQYGIRVNALCPGFLETPIHDAAPNVSEYLNSEKNKRPPNKYHAAGEVIKPMMRGIVRNRAIIIAPYKHKAYWWLYRISPALIIYMWERIIRYLKK